MSITDNRSEYNAALVKAHNDFPLKTTYPKSQKRCNHNYNFVVFCDGGDWDIVRCQKCGSEKICPCSFDDDYD